MATAASASNAIQATLREAKGKNEARRVRRAGRLPATLYGAGKPPVSISVDPKQIAAILHSATGHNTIFDLHLGEESAKAMVVDLQHEPIKGAMLHLDLKRIAMDKTLLVKVPIVVVGEAFGVKQQGGILEQVLREIEIECLPVDIPGHVEVNITELVSGQVLRVKDLPHGGKLHFVTDEEAPVVHIVHVKEEVVAPTAEAVVEGAAAPAEPEVIKKGKQEAEGGEGTDKGAEKGKEKGKEKK
jgi:large subunit ribosomal protein L25